MNKCALCTRPATVGVSRYDIVATTFGTTVFYCDDHMFNTVTVAGDPFRITKEPIAVEKLVLHGRNAYVNK